MLMLRYRHFINIFLLGFLCVLSALALANTQLEVQAADVYAYQECKQTSISLTNLFVITKNIPIIPANCSVDAQGNARPLSPSLLGDIAIRAYAFVISLGFTIITPSLVGMGLLWIYSGIDEAQATFVKKWAQNLALGLIILIFAFVVPFTIISVFKFSPEKTNLDNFFSFS